MNTKRRKKVAYEMWISEDKSKARIFVRRTARTFQASPPSRQQEEPAHEFA
jgi:hypothetical protein